MSIRIVTDSTCDLPDEVVNKYKLAVIPLHINQGDKTFLDGVDLQSTTADGNFFNSGDLVITTGGNTVFAPLWYNIAIVASPIWLNRRSEPQPGK